MPVLPALAAPRQSCHKRIAARCRSKKNLADSSESAAHREA
jgi:hypothetical protein